MHDMGLMRKRPDITAAPVDQTREKYYPNITFNEEQMPALKGKKIGDTLKVTIQLRVTGTREASEWSDSETPQYDVEMQKVEEAE